jgi:hypothetical protein
MANLRFVARMAIGSDVSGFVLAVAVLDIE